MSTPYELLSPEALGQLETWAPTQRQQLAEWLEDAGSELQREFLDRAISAGHTPAEVHAFADELRGMSDDDAFDACTLDADAPEGYTVNQLLRAEGDPLYAYELKGGSLSPADDGEVPVTKELSVEEEEPRPKRPKEPELPAYVPGRPKPSFDSGPTVGRAPPSAPGARDLGASPAGRTRGPGSGGDLGASPEGRVRAPSAGSGLNPAVPGVQNRLMEDVLNELCHGYGLAFRECDVDGDAKLSLEEGLELAAQALARGVVVPVAIGPSPGQHRRFAVLMQAQVSGKTRAWQLYELTTQELFWANEGVLLARAELPFSNKANRRITRFALPSIRSSSF